jgi:hypothetical protein
MPPDHPKIFISYSQQDKTLVQRLVNELRAAGAEVWIDLVGIRSGDNLPERISDALEWCDTLLLMWSEAARLSKWVKKEWTNAEALDRTIIPCLLEKIPLPGILTNRVFVDFRSVEHGLKELLRALDLAQQLEVSAPVEPAKKAAQVIHGPLMDSAAPAKSKPPQADFSEGHQRLADRRKAQKTPSVADQIEPNRGPANAANLDSSGVQRKRKRVAWIAVLLVSLLSIVIYSIQNDKSAKPSGASTTSNNSSLLSNVAANKMIIDRGFYDKYKNPNGKGIVHQYKLQVIAGDSVVVDRATKLMWQQSGSTKYMTYDDAEKYIRNLNNKRFAGYSDWRLPTLEEAMSLMEREKHGNLFIDTKFFDSRQVWIWTSDKPTAGVAWVVLFLYGLCGGNTLIGDFYVRAVR